MFTLQKYLRDHYYLKIKTHKNRTWPSVLLFGILGGSFGGYLGFKASDSEDKTKYCIDFDGQEEQIFQLLDEEKKPLVRLFYGNAQQELLLYRSNFLKVAKEYHKDANFMMINCSKHYQYCRNLDFRCMPLISVTYPQDSPIVNNLQSYIKDGQYPFVESHLSYMYEAQKQFLKNSRVIPQDDFTFGALNEMENLMKIK